MLDKKEVDLISWTLFKLTLKWVIEVGSILIWVYFLLQWNCMAHSNNTSKLAYNNFTAGDDYIKYDKKMQIRMVRRSMISIYMLIYITLLFTLFLHQVSGLRWKQNSQDRPQLCLQQIAQELMHLKISIQLHYHGCYKITQKLQVSIFEKFMQMHMDYVKGPSCMQHVEQLAILLQQQLQIDAIDQQERY